MSYFSDSAHLGRLLSWDSFSLNAVTMRRSTGMFSPVKRPLSPDLHVPLLPADLLGLIDATSKDGCCARASETRAIAMSKRGIVIIVWKRKLLWDWWHLGSRTTASSRWRTSSRTFEARCGNGSRS